MFEPLRFLHVADAALYVPLGDLDFLPEPLKILAEVATLSAFDLMIEGAIAKSVDCVLLTGNTFREEDQSLRARLALVAGLEKLWEHKIPVFVLPGPDDPESAWRDIPDLPENVTLLTKADQDSETPVAIVREGRVTATIITRNLSPKNQISETDSVRESDETIPAVSQHDQIRSTPFRIGMLSEWPETRIPLHAGEYELSRELSRLGCDYLAVPVSDHAAKARGWRFAQGQTLNTQDGIAHHPGRLQALSEWETGPHGATLIEVDKAGEIRGTFLPFAAARRLRIAVPVAANAALEDIAEAMISHLEPETTSANEQSWFITWVIQGSGATLESLQDGSAESDLLGLLPNEVSGERTVSLCHQLKFQESPVPLADQPSQSELEHLYRQTLETSLASDPQAFQALAERVLAGVKDLGHADWQDWLAPLVYELDTADVLAKAYSLGREWFAEDRED